MFAGAGVLLLVVGAILRWGVSTDVDGADLEMIGLITMGGGVLLLLVAAVRGLGWMSASRRHIQVERVASPDGTHVIEETRST